MTVHFFKLLIQVITEIIFHKILNYIIVKPIGFLLHWESKTKLPLVYGFIFKDIFLSEPKKYYTRHSENTMYAELGGTCDFYENLNLKRL